MRISAYLGICCCCGVLAMTAAGCSGDGVAPLYADSGVDAATPDSKSPWPDLRPEDTKTPTPDTKPLPQKSADYVFDSLKMPNAVNATSSSSVSGT